MVDVVIQTPDLDVFGGPASIDVSTDFGKPGIRGPIFWVGDKSPEAFFSPSQLTQVNINDFYISTKSDPEFYSWLYKRVPAIGAAGASWEKVLRLNQQQYSTKNVLEFDDGVSDPALLIRVSDITTDDSSPANFAEKFIIRTSFENSSSFPVASSFTYSVQSILGVNYLRIILNAVSFDGSEWNKLQGSHIVHSFVSYLS
jgi:hypothetical protein